MSDINSWLDWATSTNLASPPQNPISFDPDLLLKAVGASSPSNDGSAATSVSAAANGDNKPSAGEKLRAQASATLSAAKDQLNAAQSQPSPQFQPARYTPLETAIAAALGGALNATSPYSSEGTKALNAYMGVKQSDAETQYQNEVQRHAAAIQAAQQGYKMAQNDANPLLSQADASDQNDRQDRRSQAQQSFEQRLQDEQIASKQHEDELQRMHGDFASNVRADQDVRLQQQRILQQKLVDVMSQTGAGRALLAAQAGAALGKTPAEIVQMARIAALSPAHDVAQHAKRQLQTEPMPVAPPLPDTRGAEF